MHNSRVLNIVVLGSEHSGKSTLIDSIVFDPNRDGELPRVLGPKEFSLQLKNQDITFNFIDTNSEKTIQQAFSTMPVLSADLFVFVIDSTNEESVKKFYEEWLPYVEKSKKMLYIILTKTDLRNTEDPELFDPTQAEKYVRYQGLFKYSSKTRENIEILLFNLSNIFIFSADFLYNFIEERLTSQCHKALRRIFWLMDELNCGLVDNSTIKNLIGATDEDSVVIDENGSMDLDSFLSFMVSLILTRHEHLVWTLIQKFNYNEKLELDIDDIITDVSPDISHEDFITLSDEGKKVLTSIFKRFDRDNDGLLDENDIDEAFSLTTACPFHEMSTNYFDSCRTVEDKKIDIHSWISLWQLIVTTNCYRYIHCLFEWGCNNVDGMIEVKKKRLFRKAPEDYPNVLNCYIFGASNCGKTSVLRHFVGKPPLNTHYSTKSTQYSVVDRITYQNREYHLIVTEFEDKEIPFVLKSEELMGKCDVALLVFDGSDKFSFSFLEHIQRGLEVTIPCVYMLTKKDLGLVDQENLSVTPEQFCEALSLVWPPYLCSLVTEDGLKNIKTLFSDLLEVALNPKESGCVPNWNMNNEESDEEVESDDEDFPPKESLMKRTLKMVGVVSVFGFVAFAMMKWLKRAKE